MDSAALGYLFFQYHLIPLTKCSKPTWEGCRDPSPRETRGTQLMVPRGTCYQPDHHHPDSPKDMHGAAILSGTPQGKANDVSASPIQGRANDASRA